MNNEALGFTYCYCLLRNSIVTFHSLVASFIFSSLSVHFFLLFNEIKTILPNADKLKIHSAEIRRFAKLAEVRLAMWTCTFHILYSFFLWPFFFLDHEVDFSCCKHSVHTQIESVRLTFVWIAFFLSCGLAFIFVVLPWFSCQYQYVAI